MPVCALSSVDWRRPWLRPLREPGLRVAERVARGATVAQALNAEARRLSGTAPPRVVAQDAPRRVNRAALPRIAEPAALPRFIDPAALPPGEAYEAFVDRTGSVPTRDHLHDLFNGLIWLTRPALKWRLNALHAQAIAQHGVGPTRGPLRDALTLFDEYGALFQAPRVLRDALRRRAWGELFVGRRALWRGARVVIVGHALLEQLACAPRRGLTAHAWAGDPLAAGADAWRGKPWQPLPVLGVPGWWPANEDPAFYDDAAVFRPPKALCRAGAPALAA